MANYSMERYYDGTIVAICLTQADTFWSALFFISTISVFFFLPLAVLLILYAVIARTLIAAPPPAVCHNALKYRRQVVMMLGAVVVAFFICLLPFRALTLWIIIVPTESLLHLGMEGYYNLLYFCRMMFYLNSAVNPILYNIMSSKFRNGFFRLCGYRRKRKRLVKADITRKSTSSTQTESFWSRYSNKTSSRKSSSSKDTKPTEFECRNIVKNNTECSKGVYVRISLSAIHKNKLAESFV